MTPGMKTPPKERKPGLGAYRWPVGFDAEAGRVIEEVAEQMKRKVADVIRDIVVNHLREKGLLKPPPDPWATIRANRKDGPKK